MTEKKDIKDYLHLYLGCDCDRSGRLERIDYSFLVWCENNHRLKDVKPILRALSDMTEEEIQTLYGIYNSGKECKPHLLKTWYSNFNWHYADASQHRVRFDAIPFLLSRGFDLFNLIPDGLAINKSSLKNS